MRALVYIGPNAMELRDGGEVDDDVERVGRRFLDGHEVPVDDEVRPPCEHEGPRVFLGRGREHRAGFFGRAWTKERTLVEATGRVRRANVAHEAPRSPARTVSAARMMASTIR